MADNTDIEWTDATWNPITGCSVVSAGCKHCYAMKLAGTRLAQHPSRAGLTIDTKAGPVWTGEVRFNEQWLDQPLRWRRPRRIFVCAHGDLFHEAVSDEWIDRVFAVMALAPHHQFQVLTKRAARMQRYMADDSQRRRDSRGAAVLTLDPLQPLESLRWPLPNVWLGVSVEDQAAADERIPLLLECPAAVRWISAEPLLGPVDLRALKAIAPPNLPMMVTGTPLCDDAGCGRSGPHYPREFGCRWGREPMAGSMPGLDWVVAGGESGAGARPMHPDWARSLRDQCASACVPFLFKQWGEWAPDDHFTHLPKRDSGMHEWCDGDLVVERSWRYGKKATGRLLDGVLHDGYPVAP